MIERCRVHIGFRNGRYFAVCYNLGQAYDIRQVMKNLYAAIDFCAERNYG